MPDWEYLDDPQPQTTPEKTSAGGWTYLEDTPVRKREINGVEAARAVFPDVTPTSGYRGPNHPLSKKNPKSFHALTHRAVDLPPIPGMSFSEAVEKFKKSGYVLNPDTRDETVNPVAWQTGPNWHFVFDDGPDSGGAPQPTTIETAAPPKEGVPAPANASKSKPQWEYITPEGTRDVAGSMQIEDSVEFEGIGRNDRMVLEDNVVQNNDYVEELVTTAKGKNIPFATVEKELKQKFPGWYERNKGSLQHYYDVGGRFNWVGDPSAPENNPNVGEDIVVKGGTPKTDLENKLQFIDDKLSEGYHTGAFGAYNRWVNRVGQTDEDKVLLAEQERLARAEIEASLKNNPIGDHWSDDVVGFMANVVGGAGPDYLIPGAVGKTPLTRALSAPLIQAGVDAAVQGAENAEGVTNGFDYQRNLLAAATGGALQGSGEILATALKGRYEGVGQTLQTYDNPRVVTAIDGSTGEAVKRGDTKVSNLKADVGEEVAKYTEGWTNSPDFVIHGSGKSFAKAEPDLYAKLKTDGAEKSALGFYGEDGKVHILAHNLDDLSQVKSLVFHEALGHAGLSKKFGNDLLTMMQDLYDRSPALRREADKLGKGKYEGVYGENPSALLVEEVLAKRSEKGVLPVGVLDRLRATMAPYLRDLGLTSTLSNSEVKMILRDAHDIITKGEGGGASSGLRYALTTHVSPHDFTNADEENPYGKFDHSKMGTGEGYQVYGYGTYSGEQTRASYYDKFSRDVGHGIAVDTKPFKDALYAHYEKDFSADSGKVYNAVENLDREMSYYQREGKKDYPDVQDFIKSRIENSKLRIEGLKEQLIPVNHARDAADNGRVRDTISEEEYILDGLEYLRSEYLHDTGAGPKTYEIDVPQERQDRMILWDEPMDNQPQAVKDVAKGLGLEHVTKDDMLDLQDRRAQADDVAREYYEKNIQPVYDEGQKRGEALYSQIHDEITSSEEALTKAYNTFKDKLPGRREMTGRHARNQNTFDGPSYKPKALEDLSVDELVDVVNDIAWRKVDRKIGDWTREQLKDKLPEYRRLAKIYDDIQERIDNARYLTGESFYKEVVEKKGSPKAASEYLAEKGIPGNKYKDGFSRSRYGEPSYNYVHFNDTGPDAPKIINKYMLKDDLPKKTLGKFMQAMKGARILNEKFTADVAANRESKLSKLKQARASTSGEKGLYAELSALKGKTNRPVIEPFRDKFSKKEAKALFDVVKNNPNLGWYESIRARKALLKLFEGEVPTRGELDLLGQVYPREFVRYALNLRSKGMKLKDAFIEGTNLPRALMASVDFSAPFRQGVFLVGRKEFYKNFLPMFKHAFNKDFHDEVMKEIRERPTYGLMEDSGLAITRDGGLDYHTREEAFMSRWAEEIPGLGRFVKGSERAYVGFLNKLRADVFDDLVEKGSKVGVDFTNDSKAAKSLASYINHATGRGSFGKSFDKAAPLLTGVFFSPRLIASRVNLLNPGYYMLMHPFVRKQALRDLASFGAITATVLGLAVQAGYDVETDMRSSDFGKIRDGKTRYDVLGGFSQYLTLAARISTNQTKTLKGQVRKLTPFTGGNRLDVTERFFENKLAPIPSYFADYLRGTNPVGEKFHPGKDAIKRFIPLVLQDMAKGWQEEGVTGVAKKTPAILGVGSNTFDQVPSKYDPYGRDVEAAPDKDPVIDEISRLSELTESGEHLVAPVTSKNLPKGEIRDAAKPEDIEAFQKLSGEYIYADLKETMASEDWKEMTDQEKIDLVNLIKREQRKNAREDLFPAAGDE